MIIESKIIDSNIPTLMNEFSVPLTNEDSQKQKTIEYGKEIISDNAISVLANL